MPQKKQFQTEDLFNSSEDDYDILNSVKESCINYSTDFDKWTVHHYYAMKKREDFPNMFFYYFPRSLFLMSKISEKEKAKIAEYIFNNNNKNLNGKWGYLSLLLENKNINGVELFNSIYNNRSIVDLSNSFPLKEDAKPDFDKDLELEVKNTLDNKKELYNKVLEDFENYLKEQTSEETKKKYYNFIKKHEDLYIYCDKSNNLCELINQINGVKYNNKNKNNKQANDNVFLLPKNYYELYDNIFNKGKDKKNDKLNKNNSNSNELKKAKKKLRKKNKLYKCDFDLDFFDESFNNSLVENNNFEIEINNNLNVSNANEQSQNIQNKKYKKKDLSLSSNIKYLEDKDKEQYFRKNDFNNNQNRNTLNINNSINLSTNCNIFSNNSNANDTNLITNQSKKNKNDESNMSSISKMREILMDTLVISPKKYIIKMR